MNTSVYNQLSVSSDAKTVAKDIISTLHDASVNLNTGEIAFWLNIPVTSDRIAIAVYVHDVMDTHDFVSAEQTLADITKMMPVGLLKSIGATFNNTTNSNNLKQTQTK